MKILTPALRSSNTPNPMRFITCFTARILTRGSCVHPRPISRRAGREAREDVRRFQVHAGGALTGGRYLRLKEETPMANLSVTTAQLAGTKLDRFGDSTGALALG